MVGSKREVYPGTYNAGNRTVTNGPPYQRIWQRNNNAITNAANREQQRNHQRLATTMADQAFGNQQPTGNNRIKRGNQRGVNQPLPTTENWVRLAHQHRDQRNVLAPRYVPWGRGVVQTSPVWAPFNLYNQLNSGPQWQPSKTPEQSFTTREQRVINNNRNSTGSNVW